MVRSPPIKILENDSIYGKIPDCIKLKEMGRKKFFSVLKKIFGKK